MSSVVTGIASLRVAAGSPIAPERWNAKPARLARTDRLCALALVAVDTALGDAGLSPEDAASWDGDQTAVVLGTAFGCHATNEDYYRGYLAEGLGGASPRLFAYTLPSSPVGEISIHHGIRGPAVALTPGLTAGIDAVTQGLREIAAGRADRVLVAAAEVSTPLLARLLALSEPPPDAAAALVLERAELAARRGAAPRGRVVGTASAFLPRRRTAAIVEAVVRAAALAEVGVAAVERVHATPADLDGARAADVGAPARLLDAALLGVAGLTAVVEALAVPGLALVVAGDPAGAASAALVEAAGA
jgi:3-oxoacyl-[acyl-carrier-protein] synthase II